MTSEESSEVEGATLAFLRHITAICFTVTDLA